MKSIKRIIAVLLVSLFVLPFSLFSVSAAEGDWTFIDGENITRQINTAVIYRGIESSGQTRWGLNLVIDADGVVTAMYAGGNSEGENLKIPEGGAVISASGVRLGWFDEKAIHEICALDGTARLVISLGYAKEDAKVPDKKRKALDELVSEVD